jgi:hypothetical protein
VKRSQIAGRADFPRARFLRCRRRHGALCIRERSCGAGLEPRSDWTIDRCRGRNRRQQGDHQDAASSTDVPRGRSAIARFVEQREHASFDLRRPCHADRNRRHSPPAKRVGKIQQIAGIFTGLGARRQHPIIAGELPLHAQTPRDPPDQGMHPVSGACQRSQCLCKAIPAGHMRQFVKQHRAPAVRRPVIRHCGKQDGRPRDAERHRHYLGGAAA